MDTVDESEEHQVSQTKENTAEAALKAAEDREQSLYTIMYMAAAIVLLAMHVSAFAPALLILGAGLYNFSKLGKKNHWFQRNGFADWTIGISYIIITIAGTIAAFLYMLHVL